MKLGNKFILKIILNKTLLVKGIKRINPIKSVKNPGIIKSIAAKAMDAPEISS